MSRPRVLILAEILPHYRQRFFTLLREALAAAGIDLVLVYGQPHGDDVAKGHTVEVPWGHKIRNRLLRVGSRQVCWQPALRFVKEADLVVVEQASRMLVNYVLLGAQGLGLKKMAFWGHGQSFRTDASRVGEALKRWTSRRVHWWFAYNDRSAEVVATLGFPRSRITSVRNAIDTRALLAARAAVDEAALQRLRAALELEGRHTCLFVGGMYAQKRLDFLIDACRRIREQVPDFEMLFIGAGPDAPRVQEAARRHAWMRYVGVRLGPDAVPYFMLSKLLLMPGLVGLAVLDALALEVPLVTTAVPFHSPEIAYLRAGHNGVMVEDADDAQAFADAVTALLLDEVARRRLMAGCRHDAPQYTVETMAERFAEGIGRALAAPLRRRTEDPRNAFAAAHAR